MSKTWTLFASALLIFPTVTSFSQSETLEALLWKNRVILYFADEKGTKALADLIQIKSTGIAERDLKFVRVNGPLDLPFHYKLADEELLKLQKHWSFAADQNTFVLIGKDGGLKSRQNGALDLKSWFALIDSMPMRQQEMESKSTDGAESDVAGEDAENPSPGRRNLIAADNP